MHTYTVHCRWAPVWSATEELEQPAQWIYVHCKGLCTHSFACVHTHAWLCTCRAYLCSHTRMTGCLCIIFMFTHTWLYMCHAYLCSHTHDCIYIYQIYVHTHMTVYVSHLCSHTHTWLRMYYMHVRSHTCMTAYICIIIVSMSRHSPSHNWEAMHTSDHNLRAPPHAALLCGAAVAAWWLGGSHGNFSRVYAITWCMYMCMSCTCVATSIIYTCVCHTHALKIISILIKLISYHLI